MIRIEVILHGKIAPRVLEVRGFQVTFPIDFPIEFKNGRGGKKPHQVDMLYGDEESKHKCRIIAISYYNDKV